MALSSFVWSFSVQWGSWGAAWGTSDFDANGQRASAAVAMAMLVPPKRGIDVRKETALMENRMFVVVEERIDDYFGLLLLCALFFL